MSALSSFRKWLALKRYQFEVTFSVYMFTPWEKFFFNSLLFLLVSLTFIAACLYLPHHISFLINRAWYYINGEHIDVAEVAKDAASEVLKEISTGLTHPAAETVVREL